MPHMPKFERPKLGLSIPTLDLKMFSKLSRREKLHYIGYIVLLPATILMFIYGISTNADAPDKAAQKQPPTATTQKTEENFSSQSLSSGVNILQSGNSLTQNPFIESSKLALMDGDDLQMDPAIPNHVSTGNIPSIPSSPSYIPRPNFSASLPAIPQTIPQTVPQTNTPRPSVPAPIASSQSQQPTVSGVLTGEDGNNMAIMSDGKVVSAGDNYNGDRIAYIGGDGIKFDNGHSIGYN